MNTPDSAVAQPPVSGPPYTKAQRGVALMYGVMCHGLFAMAVLTMAASLYTGMAIGLGPFKGATAIAANLLLLLQFPIVHSLLLSSRGREVMAKLAPLRLGRALFSTIFAIVASLQLLFAFFLWSPSDHVVFEFTGAWRVVCSVLFGASWLLLVKSMNDADLGFQMGYLGWLSVWKGRVPRHKPFEPRGLFRYSRQPIYAAFALILWTGPVWTPDHLALAIGWTLYCLVGPFFKERRYEQMFGEKFAAYQCRVPYWLPRFKPALRVAAASPTSAEPTTDCDVLIVGAGPVGLLLANLLGTEGVRCTVVEERDGPPTHSMAIGVTPPSLKILSRLDLDDEFVQRGVAVAEAFVHEDGALLGSVSFARLPGGYPFVLSLPQSETIRILHESAQRWPHVRVVYNTKLVGLEQDANAVTAVVREAARDVKINARYIAGCDGHESGTRQFAGIPARTRFYGSRFAMADFRDSTDFGSRAHLFFGPRVSVESFPLPEKCRRWIVLADPDHQTANDVAVVQQRVRNETSVDLTGTPALAHSMFRPKRMLCATYHRGRVVLCGDAAHVMSPIGGQGMNTGFADAEFLAFALTRILRYSAEPLPLLNEYTRIRKRAFRIAANRAACGMWLGTRTGWFGSAARRWFISTILLRPTVKARLAPYFAMQTIPFNTLEACGVARTR